MTTIAPAAPRSASIHKRLPTTARAQVTALLKGRLADVIELQTQCKQAHSNLTGPGFAALHEWTFELWGSAEKSGGLMAEGPGRPWGAATSTAHAMAGRSALDEYPIALAVGNEHVSRLSASLEDLDFRIRSAIRQSDGLEDSESVALCTEISRGVDTWRGIVEAHLQAID